jgi:calcium channel MID1
MPNPLCPGISYTAPLSPNTTESPLNITQHYPITTLPEDIATVITNSLEAFSTSILAQPCGRDLFSHTSTCADCFAAYRDWLCRALVPQCASTAPRDTVLSDQAAEEADDVDTYPQPQTIARQPGNSTNGFGAAAYGYTELLPCLSVCNAVDRQCPVNLHFRCPRRGTTANETYAFIGQKHSQGDGSAESRFPAGDKWGNRWCNG